MFFKDRTQDQIERWQRKGLIDEHTAANLRKEAAQHAGVAAGARLTGNLGMMGAALLAAGLLMFVSANWEAMSRLARFALLLAGLWSLLFGSVALRRLGHDWLAEGMLKLAAVAFGASIWLIAQSYHLHGNYLDAVFLWGAGALLIGLLLHGQGATALGLGLLGYWGGASVENYSAVPSWAFLPLWVLAMLAIWRHDWRMAMHVALLSLLLWLLARASLLPGMTPSLLPVLWACLGVMLFVAGMLLHRAAPARRALLNIVSAHGAAHAVLAVVAAQQMGHWFIGGFTTRLWLSGAPLPGDMPPWWEGVRAWPLAVLLGVGALGWGVWRQAITLTDALALGLALVATTLSPRLGGGLQVVPVYWLLSLVVLLLAVWLVASGIRLRRPRLSKIGHAIFMLEVLLLYVQALGGLLQTSLLFLGGGVLFIVMALAMAKLRRIMVAKEEDSP